MRRDFFKILKYLNQKQFIIEIFTNGTFLTSEIIKKLIDLNVFKLSISLYGSTEKIHDKITQTEGSFYKTMKGIENAKKREIKVKLKTPIIRQNFSEIENLKILAKKLNCEILFNPLISDRINHSDDMNTFRISNKQLIKLKQITQDRFSKQNTKKNNFLSYCSAGKYFMWINPYGKICACLGLPYIGDIFKKSIIEIWKSKEMKEIANYLSIDDLKYIVKNVNI